MAIDLWVEPTKGGRPKNIAGDERFEKPKNSTNEATRSLKTQEGTCKTNRKRTQNEGGNAPLRPEIVPINAGIGSVEKIKTARAKTQRRQDSRSEGPFFALRPLRTLRPGVKPVCPFVHCSHATVAVHRFSSPVRPAASKDRVFGLPDRPLTRPVTAGKGAAEGHPLPSGEGRTRLGRVAGAALVATHGQPQGLRIQKRRNKAGMYMKTKERGSRMRGSANARLISAICLLLSAFCFYDPLTRPAPADETAGCGPPSPPRGRGAGLVSVAADAVFLPTAYCRLPTADCLLPSAYCSYARYSFIMLI